MDIDDPESFVSNLPSERALALELLNKSGFNYAAGARYCDVATNAFDGGFVRVRIQSHLSLGDYIYDVTCLDKDSYLICHYMKDSSILKTARAAADLVVKLRNNEVRFRAGDHQLVPVTNESMKTTRDLIEGGHKPGCTCGFCKNKGSFGKKKGGKSEKDCKPGDKDCDEPKKKASDGPKITAEGIVSKMLDD